MSTAPRSFPRSRKQVFHHYAIPGLIGSCLVISTLAIGCGGGGDDTPGPLPSSSISPNPSPSSSTAPTTTLRTELSWAVRGRAINAGSSALSVVFSLASGDPNTGGAITFPAYDRRDPAPGYSETYSSPTVVRTGANTLTATFYSGKGGTGSVVGRLTQNFTLGTDGAGPGIGSDLASGTTVASVTVQNPGTLTVGASRDLGITARDAQGTDLGISSGSAVWSLLSSGASNGTPAAVTLNPAGQLAGTAIGLATFQGTVDGKQSDAFTVTVLPAGAATVQVPALQSVGIGATTTLIVQAFDASNAEIPVAGSGRQLSIAPAVTGAPVGGGSNVLDIGTNGAVTGKASGFAVVQAGVTGVNTTVNQSVFVGNVVSVDTGKYTGLKYIDITVGTGASPTVPGGSVQVNYTGSLLAGSKFDSSVDRGQPAVFALSGVIDGFAGGIGGGEGITPMKIGGRRIIVMPPKLGYGDSPRTGIPAGSTLVFDVELLNAN